MVKEAVIYCRVSTNLQIGDNHVTMELQEKRGREFAARTGYTVVKICSDAGISGKNRKNRKGLSEALSLLKKDDALIVFNLSRLARNTRETLEIFEEIQKKKAHLLSVTENINSADAVGRLWITLLSSLAQFERETTAERVSKAMEYKKQKGERVGRIPFGYQLSNGKGSLLIENPEEQKIIQLIHQKRETLDSEGRGKSYRKIASELNAEKIPAGKSAKRWYPTACERIIKRKPITILEEKIEEDDEIQHLLEERFPNLEIKENQEDHYQPSSESSYQPSCDPSCEKVNCEKEEDQEKVNDEKEEDQDENQDEDSDQEKEDSEDLDDSDQEDFSEEDQEEKAPITTTLDLSQTLILLQRAIDENWPQNQIKAIRSLLDNKLLSGKEKVSQKEVHREKKRKSEEKSSDSKMKKSPKKSKISPKKSMSTKKGSKKSSEKEIKKSRK